MCLSLFARKALVCGCLALAAPVVGLGQTNSYLPNGAQYAIAGSLLMDQVHPQLALNAAGGYLVWEDNITDGDGLGVSALKLDAGFSGQLSSFRVNFVGAGDQERPQVSLLNGGGAAFVWQGGPQGFQHIYARFLSAGGTWVGHDVLVNTFTGNSQINPTVATLANGNVVVAWASFNQISGNSLQDVYAQLLSPAGQKVGGEFLVNAFTAYNQRTPVVAALSGGGFVVVWISEQERWTDAAGPPSVDVYGRLYNASGMATGGEFLVNTGTNICANPSVAAGSDGGFMVTWGEKDLVYQTNSWDVLARPFSSTGSGGTTRRVNTFTFGDQYAPKVAAAGTDFLVVWTSLGQDGSQEGVYGQFLRGDGSALGGEMLVNTAVINAQIHPCVASDGAGRFLAAWSSYIGGPNSFDLFAQRYAKSAPPLAPMSAPLVYVPFVMTNGHYQPQIEVFWAVQSGLPVDHYEVYADGAGTATASVTTNVWTMTAANGLGAGSTHSFQVLCATTDGRRSPLSPATSATTWSGISYYGIPGEWMVDYWGDAWPSATTPLAPGGPTPLQAFLTGANPLDPTTWLRTTISQTAEGCFLNWNAQPGLTYQVQSSSNLSAWVNVGSPRLALGSADSYYLGLTSPGYYRILRLR
jgi:hypothetical protein